MSESINVQKRGKYIRTAGVRAKAAIRTIDRALAQYIRSCDTRVGKWLRLNNTEQYNEVLDKTDATVKRQKQ